MAKIRVRLPNIKVIPRKPIVRGVPNNALIGGSLILIAGTWYYLTSQGIIDFRIPSGFDQKEPTPEPPATPPGYSPIPTIGGDEIPSPITVPGQQPQPYPYPYPPIVFPTPTTSSGTGGTGGGDIDDVPTGCPAGYLPNANGVCTLATQLYPCPSGYARNTTTGVCEEIPVSTGQGDITKVDVPSNTPAGQSALIETWFTNSGSSSRLYYTKITVDELGLSYTSPYVQLSAGQSSKISTNILVPTGAPNKTYAAKVELRVYSGILSAGYLQDSENFNLTVAAAPTTPGPGTGTITFTQTSIARGSSFPITFSGFAANEIVDFIAKVGGFGVGVDAKSASSTGAGTLASLYIRSDSPTGTATVTGIGRTSGRVGTKTITVTGSTTSTGGTPSMTFSKTSVRRGSSFSIVCINFHPNTKVYFTAKIGTTTVGTDGKTTDSIGRVTLDTLHIYSNAPTGTAMITAKSTSGTSVKQVSKSITVTS